MNGTRCALVVCAVVAWGFSAAVLGNVVIDTVPVGNPGNVGELSGAGVDGYGIQPDRICGAVDYVYNIGKYEVTAGQYTEFLNAVAATDTYALYNTNMADTVSFWGCNIQRNGSEGNYTYRVGSGSPEDVNNWANRPVKYVGWGSSARFANWMHNGQPTGAQELSTTEDGSYYLNGAMSDAGLMAVTRKAIATWVIPSEDEWYKAAYHKNDGVTGNYWKYPTGTDTVPGRDMSEGTNPGNNANYYGDPWPIDSGLYYTTVAREFELSDSPYGTFDQGGNVWEWNEATLFGSYRARRGGSFKFSVDCLRASNRDYDDDDPYDWYDVGFRLSEVPEPATIVMLALGCTVVLRRREHGRA